MSMYYCEFCEYTTKNHNTLLRHNNSKKHKEKIEAYIEKINKEKEEYAKEHYTCKDCNVICKDEESYNRHLLRNCIEWKPTYQELLQKYDELDNANLRLNDSVKFRIKERFEMVKNKHKYKTELMNINKLIEELIKKM